MEKKPVQDRLHTVLVWLTIAAVLVGLFLLLPREGFIDAICRLIPLAVLTLALTQKKKKQ